MRATISARAVVTPDGILADHTVTAVDGEIVEIAPAPSTPEHALLSPGFVDLQVNGHHDIDVATLDDGDWSRFDDLLCAQGVTTFCPTLISAEPASYEAALDRVARYDARPGPRPTVAGVHLEGPFLGDRPGAHQPTADGPIDIDWLASLADAVAIITIGPERPNAIEAIGALTAHGIVVALGHTAADYDRTTTAIVAGATLFTHAFNASAPLNHRAPGPVGAALSNDDVAISLIVDGIHIHPAVAKIAWRAKPSDKVILITDAAAWASSRLSERAVNLVDGAPRLADGTLAGSRLTMPGAIRNSVREVGIGLVDVINAATSNPARLLGLADRGAIAVGRRADLVALDADFAVEATWIGGQQVWPAR
ncbi:MAG: N-acetylglucosamine-6-phosphate deacetylase [Acidimicrobiales bacterium]|nr:N-acetylglucosamine-6-phosphate deacetylase [Acidimicrobiales bacterium]